MHNGSIASQTKGKTYCDQVKCLSICLSFVFFGKPKVPVNQGHCLVTTIDNHF